MRYLHALYGNNRSVFIQRKYCSAVTGTRAQTLAFFALSISSSFGCGFTAGQCTPPTTSSLSQSRAQYVADQKGALASPRSGTPSGFERCRDAGRPILKTYPPRCMGADGIVYTPDSLPQQESSPAQEPRRSLCDDRCGNGICEEVVCLAEGCPCAESHERCPGDCPAS